MDLIQKAIKKGFISKIQTVHDNLISPDGGELKQTLYYLWMCELQKWLRETVNISVEIRSVGDSYDWDIVSKSDIKADWSKYEHESHYYETYEQALERGLQVGLKLI